MPVINGVRVEDPTVSSGQWVYPNGTPLPVDPTTGVASTGTAANGGNFYGDTARGATGAFTVPEGWTQTGGGTTAAFFTNNETGEVVMVAKGDAYGPGTEGQIVQKYTADEWAKEQQRNGVTSSGELNEGRTSLYDTVKPTIDSTNVVGHPGISDEDAAKIDATVRGAVGGDGIDPSGLPGLGGLGGGGGALTGDAAANIQAAIARQNAIADAQGAAAANYQSIAAPTIAGPGQINAAMAGQLDPIQAAIAQAQQAQAAQINQTALTPEQQAIQAQQIAAAQLGPTQSARAAQIGATAVGPTALSSAARIDPTQQAQFRASQTGLVSGLEGAIAGKDPSAAEIMLRNATDRNVANQYAMAQAANGMNTGLAQRTAMINASEMNQNAIMQQALLRAQEITAARGQLGSVLDSARGADIGLATNQAGLQQQTGLANQSAQNTSTLTQAQLDSARQLAQGQLTTGVSQFNAGQTNDATALQAQLAQQANIANQGASLQAGTTNATLAQQVALANAAAQNQTYQQNAQLQQGANLQNAQLGTQASIANAGNITGANTASAQLANAVNLANANNQSQANLTQAQLDTQSQIASANNQVSTNALNQKAVQDLTANQLTASGQAGQTSIGQGDLAAKQYAADQAYQAALITGATTAGAKLISDRRQKTDVEPIEAEIAEFTSKLSPYTFRYKAPGRPGAAPGKRFGVMAQDLEKSAIGRTLVREMDDGTKAIDVPQSIGAILATLSAMNKRIEAR